MKAGTKLGPLLGCAALAALTGCAQAVDGAPGPQGIQGEQGEVGDKGETGDQGPVGPVGPIGAEGLAMLTRNIDEPPGAACLEGGVRLELGADANRDGTLDDDEVDEALTTVLCHGVTGPQGAQGLPGVRAVIRTGPADVGACPLSGIVLEAGLDIDGDGALSDEEVDAALTRVVCDGATGPVGPQGDQGIQGVQGPQGPQGFKTIAATTTLAPGAECPAGGVTVSFGVDLDMDDVLDPEEADPALDTVVCHGEMGPVGPQGIQGIQGVQGPQGEQGPQGPTGPSGVSVVMDTNALAVGDAACPTGGVRLRVGRDTDFDDVLDEGEVLPALTRVVCNGIQGPQGAQGVQGVKGDQGEQGPQGPQGPQGVKGDKGDRGDTGATGPRGFTGPTGPQGPEGPQGPQGPPGTGGGGLRLYDAANRLLGTVVDATRGAVSFVTSTGHLMTLEWTGDMYPGQIYYSGGGCTGTAVLNAGWSEAGPIFSKTVVYSYSRNSLMEPAVVHANGTSPLRAMSTASIDNPTCGTSSGTNYGWELKTTTPAGVGLPSYPVAAPLQMR